MESSSYYYQDGLVNLKSSRLINKKNNHKALSLQSNAERGRIPSSTSLSGTVDTF